MLAALNGVWWLIFYGLFKSRSGLASWFLYSQVVLILRGARSALRAYLCGSRGSLALPRALFVAVGPLASLAFGLSCVGGRPRSR